MRVETSINDFKKGRRGRELNRLQDCTTRNRHSKFMKGGSLFSTMSPGLSGRGKIKGVRDLKDFVSSSQVPREDSTEEEGPPQESNRHV